MITTLKTIFRSIIIGMIIASVTIALSYILGVHTLRGISNILTLLGCGLLLFTIAGFYGQSDSLNNDIRVNKFVFGKRENTNKEKQYGNSVGMNLIIITIVVFVYTIILWR